MNILDALGQFDTLNEEHWTSDELPAMKVVHEITGDSDITRKDVTSVAPLFTKSNPILPTADDVTGDEGNTTTAQPSNTTGDGSGDAQGGPSANGDTGAQGGSEASEEQPEQSKVAKLRSKYADKQAEIEAMRKKIAKNKKKLVKLETEESELHDKLLVIDPPLTNAQLIRQSIEASNKQRLKDAEDREKLLALLPKGAKVPVGFPVDEVRPMAASPTIVDPLNRK